MLNESILQNDLHVPYQEFFQAFGYNQNDEIFFRTFQDDKSRSGPAGGRNMAITVSYLDSIIPTLKRENDAGRGVYWVVNGGGQSDAEVKTGLAAFMELDDIPFADQVRRIADFPLQPSAIIKTKKSLHTYWIYKDPIDKQRWQALQARLINYFQSDGTIKNPSRVMRLYGFDHHKQLPAVPVKLIWYKPENKYTVREMDAALPVISMPSFSAGPGTYSAPAAAGPLEWGTDPGHIARDSSAVWLEKWFNEWDVKVHGRHIDASGGAVFDVTCPWAAEHTTDSGSRQTAVIIKPDGKIGYKCFHVHCLDRTWKDYRDVIEDSAKADAFITVTRNAGTDPAGGAEDPGPAEDPLTAFSEKIRTHAYKPFATGQPFFDNVLNGGIDPQTLLILMAAPGTGKTALCQQIAEGIAARKHDVIYLNLEMPIELMFARALSARLCRYDERGADDFSPTQILRGYEWADDPKKSQIIDEEIERYRGLNYKYIQYLTTAETGNYIEDILTTLDQAGKKALASGKPRGPIVVLDYMHLVKSKDSKKDVAELLLDVVKGLKDYATRYNTSVIAISATNRASNKSGIDDSSARDSSNIEYTGDYMLSLNYWAVDRGIVRPSHQDKFDVIKGQRVRQMILRVHKCRSGQTGRTANCCFYPAGNFFFGEFEFFPAYLQDDILPFNKKIVTDYIERKTALDLEEYEE